MLVFYGGGSLRLAQLALGPSVRVVCLVCMFSPPLSLQLGTWIIYRNVKFANLLPGNAITSKIESKR
jgi:hypothetical protein